jgi:hypothetical protein
VDRYGIGGCLLSVRAVATIEVGVDGDFAELEEAVTRWDWIIIIAHEYIMKVVNHMFRSLSASFANDVFKREKSCSF